MRVSFRVDSAVKIDGSHGFDPKQHRDSGSQLYVTAFKAARYL
jgi:hypothetical protein